MAYNASEVPTDSNNTFVTSKTEPELRPPKMKSNNLDYINKWVDVTVENEIWRGKKLRQEKPLPNRTKDEYSVVNVDFIGSMCNENERYKRKIYHKYYEGKTNSSIPNSTSPFPRPTSVYPPNNGILKTRTTRMKSKQTRCSMRIAELAEPTKRQCIDTWRNKSYILPEIMVERLKQHVMDQRPIVKIPEAIYCFQKRRRQASKKPQNNFQDIMSYSCELLKPLHKMNTRMLCIIFGHKIVKSLLSPLCITLNSDWKKLSNIVAGDIAKILKSHNKTNVGYRQNKLIQADVSNKITTWIAGILEDLSFKLLEEDLRDLEEEEGPVLDFIDYLVDNVVNICEPTPESVDEESNPSESIKDEILEEESEKPVTAVESTENIEDIVLEVEDTNEILTNAEHFRNEINELAVESTENIEDIVLEVEDTNEILTNAGHFRNEINELLDSIIKSDVDYFRNEIFNIIGNIIKEPAGDTGEESGDNISKSSDYEISKGSGFNSREESDNDISKGSNNEIRHEINESLILKIETDTDKISETSDKMIDKLNDYDEGVQNAENNNSNVSGVFEIFTEDSGDDKNSKKVTFSVTDLVNPYKNDRLVKSTTMEEPEHDEQVPAQWNANNGSLKYLVMFAEPNENLLCDADESWPSELSDRPTLSLSATVSKSITSLGKIFESDEKQFTPTVSKSDVTDEHTGDTKLLKNNLIDEVKNFVVKFDIGSQTNETITKASQETTTTPAKTSATTVDVKPLDKNPVHISLIGTKALDDKSKNEKQRTEVGDSGLKIVTSIVCSTVEGNISKTRPHMDKGWKVQPDTAPSWVNCGHGHGEPSEDSIPFQIKSTKMRERDLSKWCRDLEKAFVNLEMWSEWIDTTCKETAFLLKQRTKETTCAGFRRKSTTYWIKLKKNIYKDAILWKKLHQRTEDNFKSLKRKYNNTEVVSAEYCAMCTCNKTKTRNNTENLPI